MKPTRRAQPGHRHDQMLQVTSQELLRLRVIETEGLPLLKRLANVPPELHRDGRVRVLLDEVKEFVELMKQIGDNK